jgi:hypothetical protein
LKNFTRKLLAGLVGVFKDTPTITEPEVLEIKVPPMTEQFENRNGLHFCNSCGWCDDIPTTFRKRTITDDDGKTKTVYNFLDVDNPVDCPNCAKKSVYPVCQATTTKAVIYLLKALQ